MPFERLHEGIWFAWDEDEQDWWKQGAHAGHREINTGEPLSPAPIGQFI